MPVFFHDRFPVTPRSGEDLALFHGYQSLSRLVEELPDQAHVLDVGAGLSTLGHIAASHRTDITWVNMDPAYANESIRNVAIPVNTPNNLHFVTANGKDIGKYFAPGTFDRVFSFFVLPHLDKPVAEKIVESIVTATANNGKISVGPTFDKSELSLLYGPDELIDSTIRTIKTPHLMPNEFAIRAVAKIAYPNS